MIPFTQFWLDSEPCHLSILSNTWASKLYELAFRAGMRRWLKAGGLRRSATASFGMAAAAGTPPYARPASSSRRSTAAVSICREKSGSGSITFADAAGECWPDQSTRSSGPVASPS